MFPFFDTFFGEFRDVHAQIRSALSSLPPEALDWQPGADMNSISVIIYHLTGSERFLVGDVALQESSNRNRDAEFLVKGMTHADLLQRLDASEAYMKAAFEKLTLDDLAKYRQHPRQGQVSLGWALLHALDHASVHLGHIHMTAQLWKQQPGRG